MEDEIDALFKLPLGEFTPARNALAAQFKKAGQQAQADAAKALPKPSVAAWTVNQLYWRHRGPYDRLIEAGDRFRQVQSAQTRNPAGVREHLEARREAQAVLVRIAADVLRDGGYSGARDIGRRAVAPGEQIRLLRQPRRRERRRHLQRLERLLGRSRRELLRAGEGVRHRQPGGRRLVVVGRRVRVAVLSDKGGRGAAYPRPPWPPRRPSRPPWPAPTWCSPASPWTCGPGCWWPASCGRPASGGRARSSPPLRRCGPPGPTWWTCRCRPGWPPRSPASGAGPVAMRAGSAPDAEAAAPPGRRRRRARPPGLAGVLAERPGVAIAVLVDDLAGSGWGPRRRGPRRPAVGDRRRRAGPVSEAVGREAAAVALGCRLIRTADVRRSRRVAEVMGAILAARDHT